MDPDTDTLRAIGQHPNRSIPLYLIHCYLYYQVDSPLISDDTFDALAGFIASRWPSLVHPHKSLLDPALLKSGFHIAYPNSVVGGALAYRRMYDEHRAK